MDNGRFFYERPGISSKSFLAGTFENLSLPYSDFSNFDFSDSRLTDCDFSYSDLNHSNFTNCTFIRCNFSYSNLEAISVSGANLETCELRGVESKNIFGEIAALPKNWLIYKGLLVGPEANLENCDISECELSDLDITEFYLKRTDLRWVRSSNLIGVPGSLPPSWELRHGRLIGPFADLSGSDLSDLDLKNLNFVYASLKDATITNADFSNSLLDGVESGGLIGEPSALPEGWVLHKGFLLGPMVSNCGPTLENADLRAADLLGVDLSQVSLKGVKSGGIRNPPRALPKNWVFHSGFLIGPGADLSGGEFANKRFRDTNLSGAKLIGADLTNCDLYRVNVTDLDLSGALLQGLKSRALIGQVASLPPGWIQFGGQILGPESNLSNTNIQNLQSKDLSLVGADLRDANIHGAFLGHVDMSMAQTSRVIGHATTLPPEWAQIGNCLVGPYANLEGANFKSADLSNSNLHGARLAGASFQGATGRNIKGLPYSFPPEYEILHGYLFGPGVEFRNVLFENMNLTSLNLAFTKFQNCRFENCKFTDVIWENSDLSKSKFTNCEFEKARFSKSNLSDVAVSMCVFWHCDMSSATLVGMETSNIEENDLLLPEGTTFRQGFLIGPGLSLSNRNLTHTDFRHINLTGVDFSGSNLDGCDFSEADLSGANLSNCSIRGANLSHAKLRNVDFAGTDLSQTTLDSSYIKIPIRGRPLALPENSAYSSRSNWLLIWPLGENPDEN